MFRHAVNGTRMTDFPVKNTRKVTDDPYGAAALIRRLVTEQGVAYWRRYLVAFGLMAIVAATTALSAWLLGEVINAAYVARDFHSIVLLSLATMALFMAKG